MKTTQVGFFDQLLNPPMSENPEITRMLAEFRGEIQEICSSTRWSIDHRPLTDLSIETAQPYGTLVIHPDPSTYAMVQGVLRNTSVPTLIVSLSSEQRVDNASGIGRPASHRGDGNLRYDLLKPENIYRFVQQGDLFSRMTSP